VAGKTGKRGARRGKSRSRKGPAKPPSKPAAGGRTIVQLNFHDNPPKRGNGTMGAPKGRDGRTLKGAALAAHQRAAGKRGGGHKGGGKRKNALAKTNPANPGPRRRRRRNGTTFMQALVKVAGAAAAMFGSGVVVTYGVSKIMPGSKVSGYGIPLLAGVVGAGIATKYPLVGAGVAAGGAAPFVLPVAARVMQPSLTSGSSTTVSSLRAVSSSLRHNNPGLLGAVRMSAVSMGRVSMGRHAYAH
jgi:hypothetical protein